MLCEWVLYLYLCQFIDVLLHSTVLSCMTHDEILYLLSYSMVQSSSGELNLFSASQEIPHTLWKQNVHYRI